MSVALHHHPLWSHQHCARVPSRGENMRILSAGLQKKGQLSVGVKSWGPTSLKCRESRMELQGRPTSLGFISPAWPLMRLDFVTLDSLLGAGHNECPRGWPSTHLQILPLHLTTQRPRATCCFLNMLWFLSGMSFPIFPPPPWSSSLPGELLLILAG